MNMNVHDGLACRRSDIDTNVVSRRFQLFIEASPGRMQQIHEAGHFFLRKIEEALDVAIDDNKGMPS